MTAQLVPTIERSIEVPSESPRDDQVIRMWLHGKSPRTQRSYSRTVRQFQAFTGGCTPGGNG